jgi:hypothetical protein
VTPSSADAEEKATNAGPLGAGTGGGIAALTIDAGWSAPQPPTPLTHPVTETLAPSGARVFFCGKRQAPPGGYSISNDSARYQSPPRFRSVAALEVDGWGYFPIRTRCKPAPTCGDRRVEQVPINAVAAWIRIRSRPGQQVPRVSRRATVRRCTGCHPCTGYRGKARPGHPQDDFLGATGPRAGRQEERPGGLLTPRIWHADRGDYSTLAEGWNRD